MQNPFLQDGESTHIYNGRTFIVDFYPHQSGGTWQCSDSGHIVRMRASTKDEAIRLTHERWDNYIKK